MSRRPPIGLLLATADAVVRVDLAPGGGATRSLEVARAGAADLVAAVGRALEAAPRPRAAFVLSEEVWTQTHSVPRRQIEGLDDETLASALAYELEPMTGIAADRARVAIRRLEQDDDRVCFWVSVVDSELLERLARDLHERGVRLLGLAHPAGLLSASSKRPATVEVWENATLLAHHNGRGEHLVALPARPGQRSWRRGVEEWVAALPEDVDPIAAFARRPLEDEAPGLARRRLERSTLPPQFAESWLSGACARLLESGRAPVLRPARRGSRAVDPLRIGAALIVAVVAYAAADAFFLWRRAADVQERLAAAEAESQRSGTFERASSALALRRDALSTEVADLERRLGEIRSGIDIQRRRLLVLLTEASRRKPRNVVFERIEPTDGGGLAVFGLAVGERAVDDFAEALGRTLEGAGLAVRPARVEAESGPSDVPLFRFRLPIDPVAAAAPEGDR